MFRINWMFYLETEKPLKKILIITNPSVTITHEEFFFYLNSIKTFQISFKDLHILIAFQRLHEKSDIHKGKPNN